ncbi:hypothetical protein SAMN06265222_109186 [Neorhodopirellula lusitana]|uniref:Uncharacterized protein n=1 Tax=Neorhodopirellula lusitana TaxID=445327 RepID=A0ABY1QAZ7_9BACT|nr:hypothetical protein SAMN06265222_109186 [Neorhodopirellula lusitana]
MQCVFSELSQVRKRTQHRHPPSQVASKLETPNSRAHSGQSSSDRTPVSPQTPFDRQRLNETPNLPQGQPKTPNIKYDAKSIQNNHHPNKQRAHLPFPRPRRSPEFVSPVGFSWHKTSTYAGTRKRAEPFTRLYRPRTGNFENRPDFAPTQISTTSPATSRKMPGKPTLPKSVQREQRESPNINVRPIPGNHYSDASSHNPPYHQHR